MSNPLQPYNYRQSAEKQTFDDYRVNQNIFERTFHPGKWSKSIPVSNSIVDFTGSNFGAGAIVITAANTLATASLTGGGEIILSKLPVGIHELSVSRITSADATNIVYVLIQLPNSLLG